MMIRMLIIGIVTLLAGACSKSEGPDAISRHPDYNGLTTNCSSKCHSPQSTASPDPIRTNSTGTSGKHVVHVSTRNIECTTCHFDYFNQPTHFNSLRETGTPSSGIVNFNLTGPSGSWTIPSGPGTGICSSVACHGPAVMDWYGLASWILPACTTCHTSTFSTALDPTATGGSGTAGKHSAHVSSHGIPCEKCHNNYPASTTHANGDMNPGGSGTTLVTFDSTNPTATFTNVSGPFTGTCTSLNCHPGTPLDWYGTNTWTTPPACSTCHGAPIGTRRQVLGAGGDFDQPSHHVISYAARTTEIVTDADCLVCHDMAQHMSGTVRLTHKDNAGQVISYTTPSTLEPFCLSCHDTNGASTDTNPFRPFNALDTNVLGTGRNIAGVLIAGYWNSAQTTHRNNNLTCAGTGAPNTGCHGSNGSINMHGSVSRGLLSNTMTMPIPPTQPAFNYSDYQLCFDCHQNYPAVAKEVVLGYRQNGNYDNVYSTPTFTLPATPYYTPGIASLFRDRYTGGGQPYDNRIPIGLNYTHLALHNYHLLGSYFDSLFPSIPNWLIWKYRGDAAQESRITCMACHNVHGTNSTVGGTYDNLVLTRGSNGPDLYTTHTLTGSAVSIMSSYPLSCGSNCHANAVPPSKSYWYSPADE